MVSRLANLSSRLSVPARSVGWTAGPMGGETGDHFHMGRGLFMEWGGLVLDLD